VVRARFIGRAAAVVALGSALVACSTILGFEDVTLGTGDDGGVGVDAGGDVTTMDARGDSPVQQEAGSDATSDVGEAGCGDPMTDKDNCGRCGHSCLGSTCTNGMCDAKQLTIQGAFNEAWDLALDDTHIYFTDTSDNWIYRINKDGSNPVRVDMGEALAPRAIAVDATYMYWTNFLSPNGEVRRCPIAGCNGTSVLLSAADEPSAILLLGTRVMWAERNGGKVVQADISDGGNQKVLFAGDDAAVAAQPYQLATDPTFVYFTDFRAGFTRRVPLDGGASVALANGMIPGSYGIAVNDAGIFWASETSSADGTIFRIAASAFVNNADPTVFASPFKQPAGVAIDDNYVYWVNAGTTSDTMDGSVMACPLSQALCPNPIVLATTQHNPVRIKVDADAVYWTADGISTTRDGSIWKVAKP
jgi:hypothetical protein